MKKLIKITLWTLLSLVVLAGLGLAGFVYKVKNGFPVSYETEKPAIEFPAGKPAILVFSKTTGYRHEESIDTSKKVLSEMAKANNWFIHETEAGGVFNEEQLAKFNVVIFNNSTGRVLNDEQEKALEKYVENGGMLMGIHGAGDDSHNWAWYEQNLLGTRFSHHAMNPQLQETDVYIGNYADTSLSKDMLAVWPHTDEWYVFENQPKDAVILCLIEGNKINPNGNFLWMRNKDYGMGKAHPIAWYKPVGKGYTWYTSMGHDKAAWKNPNFTMMVENGIRWGNTH